MAKPRKDSPRFQMDQVWRDCAGILCFVWNSENIFSWMQSFSWWFWSQKSPQTYWTWNRFAVGTDDASNIWCQCVATGGLSDFFPPGLKLKLLILPSCLLGCAFSFLSHLPSHWMLQSHWSFLWSLNKSDLFPP